MSGVDPALQSFINQETEKQRFQVRKIKTSFVRPEGPEARANHDFSVWLSRTGSNPEDINLFGFHIKNKQKTLVFIFESTKCSYPLFLKST